MYQPRINKGPAFAEGRVLVSLKKGTTSEDFQKTLANTSYKILKVFEKIGVVTLECPKGKEKESCDELSKMNGVESVDVVRLNYTMAS